MSPRENEFVNPRPKPPVVGREFSRKFKVRYRVVYTKLVDATVSALDEESVLKAIQKGQGVIWGATEPMQSDIEIISQEEYTDE